MKETINGVVFECDQTIDAKEATAYVERAKELYPKVSRVKATIYGDDIELTYFEPKEGFERIRRITGYLVGTLDRFNDAKKAEEHDRVKHAVGA